MPVKYIIKIIIIILFLLFTFMSGGIYIIPYLFAFFFASPIIWIVAAVALVVILRKLYNKPKKPIKSSSVATQFAKKTIFQQVIDIIFAIIVGVGIVILLLWGSCIMIFSGW